MVWVKPREAKPFGLTQLIRRAVDPGLEKLVGGPVGLSAVHRSLPQHATLAPALGLGQDGEVLGHELRAADGVGADRHRADRAHDAALKGGGKDRAASSKPCIRVARHDPGRTGRRSPAHRSASR